MPIRSCPVGQSAPRPENAAHAGPRDATEGDTTSNVVAFRKAGDGDSAPIDLTNDQFLRALFAGEAEHAWVTAFPDDPDVTRDQAKQGKLWGGAPVASQRGLKLRKAVDQNTFYVISTFNADAEGKVRRRKALFRDCRVIMIDDVGQPGTRGVKVSADDLELIWGIEPSYIIETSPGNCQWGLILKEPETRQWAVEQLQDGMIKQGLTADQKDPGMANVTRYCRLPQGVNTKAKHVKANGGEPWRHRLHVWEPRHRYTVEELAALFEIELVEPEALAGRGGAVAPDEWPDDPVLAAIQDAGLLQGPIDDKARGYHVTCFNQESHTGGRDDGAAYFRRGSVDEQGKMYPIGGFHCFHGGCAEKNVGHLIQWLQNEGYLESENRTADEVFAGINTGESARRRIPSTEVRKFMECADKSEKPIHSCKNIRIFLELDEDVADIEYNAFSLFPMLGRQRMRDVDIVHLKHLAIKNYGVEFPTARVHETVDVVADSHRFDPVREYLEALEWDSERRLETWLLDYAGVEEDNVYTREIARKVLVAAVTRSFEPGAKFDNMLIIEGTQGAGKSALIRDLCPYQEWFLDSHLPINRGKDAAEMLREKLIVEIPELASIKRADVEPLKAFLSQQQDDYRPPYGRHTRTHPRRCVFIGTTNESHYLKDTTGSRRFWPVAATGKIRWRDMSTIRDQLWAEAVVAYRNGESVNLSADAYRLATIAAEQRFDEDEWTAPIKDYLERNHELRTTTSTDIARGLFGIDGAKCDRGLQNRISSILQHLGWKRGTVRVVDEETGKRSKSTTGFKRPDAHNLRTAA